MKNNQIGIVGLGYWGTNIINALYKLKKVDIVCYDKNEDNSKEIKKKFRKAKIVKSFDEFLKLKLDGVIVSVSTSHLFSVAKRCLLAGHNIFIEKPVSENLTKLKILEKIAKRKKRFIMSGYIYYYNNYIHYIKKIIRKNHLGKILYVNFERSNLGPVRNDLSSAWDLSSHDLSICIYLFSKKINIIHSYGHDILKKKINDISYISAKIRNFYVDIKSSWLHPEKVRKIVIVGKKRMLLFNEIDFNNPIKIFDKYAFYPKTKKFNKSFFTQKANIYLGKTHIPKIKSTSPLDNELNEFLNCIKLKKNPKTSIKIAHYVMKVLQKLN